MAPEEILHEIKQNFDGGQRRKFLPALLIAFISTLRELGATGGKFADLADLYGTHPRRLKVAGGKSANTLIFWRDKGNTTTSGKSLSIRPAYQQIETWFRADQKRFDFPSSAPHATQAWGDYQHWLDALLTFSDEQLADLEANTKAFVLDTLPAHVVDQSLVKREPPRFYLFLRDFDMGAHIGEKTGAAYQAAVFGYLRADAAHLQVDVDKVRVGSKRVGRIGDVDARDGELLVLAAEVKQYTLSKGDVGSFAELADQVALQGALGLVVALEFEDGVRDALMAIGLEPMSRADLLDRVRLWDSLKQRNAVQALLYCVHYKEKSSNLYARIKTFLSALGEDAVVAIEPVSDEPSPTDSGGGA